MRRSLYFGSAALALLLGGLGAAGANEVADHLPVVAAPQTAVPEAPAPLPEVEGEEQQNLVRLSARGSKLEAEHFTKLAVSEGGFSQTEAQALLQALEDMRNGRSLLETMFAQSPHVTKRKPYTDTRQVWVSNLPMKGLDAPEGWVECEGRDENKKLKPAGCTGTWKATAKGWAAFREYAGKLYWSGVVPSVIEGKAVQWGGDMDYWRGAGRNFCPLRSPGTKNTFWGVPAENEGQCLPIDLAKVESSRILTAKIAAGRAARRHLLPQTATPTAMP